MPSRSLPSIRSLAVAVLLGVLLVHAPTTGVAADRAAQATSSPGVTATGSVEGVVEIAPTLSARRPRFRAYGDVGLGAPPRAARTARASEMENVVVYLEPRGATPHVASNLSGAPPFEIRQWDELFVPHVLAVPRGATVSFPNEDAVYHNVFSLSRTRTFDLGRYPKGATRAVRFDKPGVVQLFCHLHADMSATILVVDSPFFITPAADGRFRLDGVPPGEYTVVGWHERAQPVRRRIRVGAGEAVRTTLSIPLASDPEEP